MKVIFHLRKGENHMNKYLVIASGNSGFAELYNVAIIKASSQEEAIQIYCEDMGREKEGLEAICIDNLVGNYYYYM
jgi:hypothetical protein